MKKVSIIVPVYNVEKYLERFLNSVVNQTLKDIEIIIVNDGSKDNSQSIIDKYRNQYPDLIKAFQIENGGAANARNYALDYVTGEYIGFVDSDDYISEEMYEKLYNRAKEKDADIVCCNYYRVIDDKKFVGKKYDNPKIVKEDVFDKNVFESNLLFEEVPYIWNKIFKTELIKQNNLKFSKDLRIYEDLVFTYEAFAKANKISRIEDFLYFYIVSRQDSLTHVLTEKRFDIFKANDKLVEYYKNLNKYEEVKDALLYVILKHIYVILEKRTFNKEKKLKFKYINTAFKFLNREFPNWKNNMYFELQQKNKTLYTSKMYWRLCVLIGVNITAAFRMLANKAGKILKFTLHKKLGRVYMKKMKKPVEEKNVLIYSQQGNNLSGNMFYIVKELATNEEYKDYNIYVGYADNTKNKFTKLLESYNLLNKVKLIKNTASIFSKKLATSKYIFTDTSMPIYFIKRAEQVYLNTWHGTPLKTLGKSTANDFFDIANVQKNFVISDYLLYPSEYMMDIMVRDYMLKGIANNKIMLCGYPRNEIFLRKDADKIKQELDLKDKTLIAYMPTWRGSVRSIDIEEQIAISENYIKQISEKLKENQILYVNMHPYVGNKIDVSKFKNVRTFPSNYETYDFLSTCDILITDYSSVFFDFAVTNKKIILFAYDEEEYFKDRGVYIQFKELPFTKVNNVNDLIEEINTPIKYDANEFLKKYCNYEKEDISKQICDKMILNKESEIKIVDMPKSDKENILIYAANFKPGNNTTDFVKLIENTNSFDKYNYYATYITENLRPNREIFRKVKDKINFYGQLGNYSNINKLDVLLLGLLKVNKNLYSKFKNRLSKINKIELTRIFNSINFKTLVIYGKVDYKKIYQFSELDSKKILYIKNENEFNKDVNKEIYNKFDYILTTNNKTYDIIKTYCGQADNIKTIEELKTIQDLEKFI